MLATLLGFGLTVLWDIHKTKQDIRKRDDAVLVEAEEELRENLNILLSNGAILAGDLSVIEIGKVLTYPPLTLLKSGSWDLMRMNLPRKLIRQHDVLKAMRQVSNLTDKLNEGIRSRENFRLHNISMTSFRLSLKTYDESLRTQSTDLRQRIETLITRLWPSKD